MKGGELSRYKYKEFFTEWEQDYIYKFLKYKAKAVDYEDRGEYELNLKKLSRNGLIPYYEFCEIWCYIDNLKYDYPEYIYSEFEKKLREKCRKEYFSKPVKFTRVDEYGRRIY